VSTLSLTIADATIDGLTTCSGGHTFCRECILEWNQAQLERAQPTSCPECRRVTDGDDLSYDHRLQVSIRDAMIRQGLDHPCVARYLCKLHQVHLLRPEAEQPLRDALRMHLKWGRCLWSIIRTYFDLGYVMQRQGRDGEALIVFRKCLEIAYQLPAGTGEQDQISFAKHAIAECEANLASLL